MLIAERWTLGILVGLYIVKALPDKPCISAGASAQEFQILTVGM